MPTDDLLRLNGESFVLFGRREHRAQVRTSLLAGAEEDGYRVTNLSQFSRPKTIVERLDRLVEESVIENPTLEPWGGEWRLYVVTDPGHTSSHSFGQSFRDELACVMRLSPVTGIVVAMECDRSPSSFTGLRHVEVSWRGSLSVAG